MRGSEINQERNAKNKKQNKLLKDYIALKEKCNKACNKRISLNKHTELVKDHLSMKQQ